MTSARTAATTIVSPVVGATAGEIERHYGLPVAFYALWLDPSLTYSCALWAGEDKPLDEAQAAKLRFHLDGIGLQPGQRLLDVGCGWGSLLRMASMDYGAQAVGLTLSEAQRRHIARQGLAGMEARLEHWQDHRPDYHLDHGQEGAYDGIVSVGAFEHFARPEDSPAERLAVYRRFFERCRDWLKPGGRLSLQTIAYSNMMPLEANPFIQGEIFPGSELPTLGEIRGASQGAFELLTVRDDAVDYQRTCDAWRSNLYRQRAAATAIVGAAEVNRFNRYLRLSAIGFATGRLSLHRLLMRRCR